MVELFRISVLIIHKLCGPLDILNPSPAFYDVQVHYISVPNTEKKINKQPLTTVVPF